MGGSLFRLAALLMMVLGGVAGSMSAGWVEARPSVVLADGIISPDGISAYEAIDAPQIPTWFDATRYRNKPSDPLPGLQLITVLSPWYVMKNRDSVQWEHFREQLERVENDIIVINLEGVGWETDPRAGVADAAEAVRRWAKVLSFARTVRPDAEFGVYRMFPIRDYWAPVRYAEDPIRYTDQMARWHEANTWLLELQVETFDGRSTTISDLFDFVAPSLYEFYEHPDRWRIYAAANLHQARRFSMSVRPFVWFQFHPSAPDGLALSYLDPAHVDLVIKTCMDHQTSPILWSDRRDWPSGGPPWWPVLKAHLEAEIDPVAR
jgi:hypothetical protein